MFRVKQSDVPWSLEAAPWAVSAFLVLAFVVSVGEAVRARAGRTASDAGTWATPVLIAAAAILFAVTWWFDRREKQTLRRAKLLAHDILASLDQGVITADTEGHVTSINLGAMRILGVGDDCVGESLGRLDLRGVAFGDLGRRVVEAHGNVLDADFTRERDGKTLRLVASAYELKDDRGATLGSIIHLRDATERLRMIEHVLRLEHLAGLSTLATGLHHEIKNPLTALSLHVQLMEERLRDAGASERVADLMGVVKGEVRRLTGILERFRTFASLDRLNRRPTDVSEILDDLATLMCPQAERQGVRLVVAAPGPAERPPRVSIDAGKFREAVLNLVVNALDAMPQGGDLTLAAHARDSTLWVEVRDSGPGIPEEVRADLFRPYVTTKARGTGIGLALTEKLVSQHGGQVTYETGPRGTTFRIRLPMSAGVEVARVAAHGGHTLP